MILLLGSAIAWIAVHVGIAGTAARDALVARLGERGFAIGFSLASVATIAALVAAYNAAPVQPLWAAPGWLRWVLAMLMLLAFVLLVAAVVRPNPTAVGGRGLDSEPRGIQRVTRHPMLWSFALWAAVHVVGNGDLASLLFFGAFLATALAGMPSIDAKLARRDPARWARFAAGTSILPGLAIAQGRNRLAWSELGWVAPVVGVVLWAALLHLHPRLFGVVPVPM